ncbi:MAG: potassium transporter TrkG [Rikenellaceae bacterium]
MKQLNKLLIYRKMFFRPYIKRLLNFVGAMTYVMSALLILTLVFENGFMISQGEREVIGMIYKWVWVTFIANLLLQVTLNFHEAKHNFRKVTWIFGMLLLLTLIPALIALPTNFRLLEIIWEVLHSKLYNLVILGTLSFLQLSSGIMSLLGKRANPSFIFCSSFAIIILVGAGMLMLPRSTYDGISFIDALFTSTSATCVTGLTTIDIAQNFTTTGLFIIALLIQIGGLGVMTLTSFFAVFFMGNASFNSQVMISDMVSSKSLNSLVSTLLYILGFTLFTELFGAALLFCDIHGTMGMTLNEEIWFSVFHSVSAFCNAGFSTLPNNLGNEMLMTNHNFFYLTISALVVLGGIGFPILVNLYATLRYRLSSLKDKYISHKERETKRVHLYNLNTRIVLLMTTILLLFGTVAIAMMEWNNAFAHLPFFDKIVQSIFNSVVPRTAGFASVSISAFSIQSLLLIMIFMVIGGGTQSTAGGIKVNVFAVVLLNLGAILRGRENVTIHNRTLSYDSIRRCNATFILYLLFIFGALFLLTIFEPEASALSLFFEAISALSTVGSSMDLTPTLGGESKAIIIALMFIGRVGVLTIMTSVIKQQQQAKKYRYPSDNIIIN